MRCIRVLILAMILPLVTSAGPREEPVGRTRDWILHFYLEDHVVARRGLTTCVVSIKKQSRQPVEVDGTITFRLFHTTADGRRGERVPNAGGIEPPAEIKENVPDIPRPRLRVIVEIDGQFDEPVEGNLRIRSGLLPEHELSSGRKVLIQDTVPPSVFQKGSYRIRAVLFDGEEEVLRSKEVVATVSDPPDAERKPERQ
jgi:hypothetical protein